MSLNYLDYKNIQKNDRGEYDGIEILVAMAKQGKIDPWNIDIVDVADKYSVQVFQTKAQNLRCTSRVLLFAAILLKMKSDILEGIEINDLVPDAQNVEFDDTDSSMYEYEDYVPTNNVISFDEVLQRRTSVRLNRNRVVTLRDLIRQLEFYAQLDKKASIKNAHERAKRRVRNYSNLSADDIINLAHDEYIKKGVERLKANLTEILDRQDKIELNELILLGMDKITAYLSLLFLAAEGEYDLVQDEFYSDLYVVKYEKPTGEEAAINNAIVQDVLNDDVHSVVDSVSAAHNNAVAEEQR
ncbi:MAG: segregation/condensation protein A [Candidatus Gastranaerophilales bacterium]|nr:segregation/condensation protein A [Candidatus Gastranaerophilales bacterium]